MGRPDRGTFLSSFCFFLSFFSFLHLNLFLTLLLDSYSWVFPLPCPLPSLLGAKPSADGRDPANAAAPRLCAAQRGSSSEGAGRGRTEEGKSAVTAGEDAGTEEDTETEDADGDTQDALNVLLDAAGRELDQRRDSYLSADRSEVNTGEYDS